MELAIKNIRNEVSADDGYRIFIDRLWPRGISKEQFKVDYWAEKMAPTQALIKWFHEDRDTRFEEFSKRYAEELRVNPEDDFFFRLLNKHPKVTLVTDVHDVQHSHVPTIMHFIETHVK